MRRIGFQPAHLGGDRLQPGDREVGELRLNDENMPPAKRAQVASSVSSAKGRVDAEQVCRLRPALQPVRRRRQRAPGSVVAFWILRAMASASSVRLIRE